MMDLDYINRKITEGNNIEDVVKDIDWREFEQLISKILEQHNFDLSLNFRFSTKNRYEIDILAIKNDAVLAIDCKHWGRGRYKKSQLKDAVKKQINRCKQLKKILVGDYKLTPLIVTLFEEEIIEHNEVFIVPLWKLNEFLLQFSEF